MCTSLVGVCCLCSWLGGGCCLCGIAGYPPLQSPLWGCLTCPLGFLPPLIVEIIFLSKSFMCWRRVSSVTPSSLVGIFFHFQNFDHFVLFSELLWISDILAADTSCLRPSNAFGQRPPLSMPLVQSSLKHTPLGTQLSSSLQMLLHKGS